MICTNKDCINYNKEPEGSGKFCPECGHPLVEAPKTQPEGFGFKMGDANAISGGVHLADSHNTTYNNTYTQIPQKTKEEIEQGKINRYVMACREAYEDNKLEPHEEAALEALRNELGLSKEKAEEFIKKNNAAMEKAKKAIELGNVLNQFNEI